MYLVTQKLKLSEIKIFTQMAFSTSAIVNLAAFPIGALKFLAVFLKEFKKYHKSLHWKETAGQFVWQDQALTGQNT